MHIPILCYHAHILPSADYADNGHLALSEDLERIESAGRRVVPLEWIVDWLDGSRSDEEMQGAVGLSFDDGTRLDFEPVQHPEHGLLPGFLPLLESFARRHPDTQPHVHATCFVIASPRARDEADRHLLYGRDWLGETWWPEADRGGRMAIESHGWDHNMAVASEAPGRDKDCFDCIDTVELAEHEIARASEYLARRLDRKPTLFGFPYGQCNDFLIDEYLPGRGRELGLRAAFATDDEPVTRDSNRWRLPRFVHGYHWRDPEGLRDILGDSAA